MLIINPTKVGDVVSLKLTNGEEIIGKLNSKENNAYVLNRPVVLTITQQGASMVPYMLTADPSVQDFTFKDTHVLHCVPTSKVLSGQYIEGTTGIKPV